MNRFKKIIITGMVGTIAIQFIRPAQNDSKLLLPTDFVRAYRVPSIIRDILQNACYDCHSNNTNYPWYAQVQPMSWLMRRHITNGKEALNFSEFGSYTLRRQLSKFKAIANQVNEDQMPLSSYRMMHHKATLNAAQKKTIIDWMQAKADSLSTNN